MTGGPLTGAAGTDVGGSGHQYRGGRNPTADPVTELAFVVLPPALHRAIRQERTGVIEPAGDGGGAGESAHRDGSGRTGPGPVAELAVVVPAPALRRAIPKQRTRVIAPGDHGGGARDSARPRRGR